MGVQTPTGGDQFRTHWTPAMDRYFISLMLAQVGRGSRIDDHLFSKQAWNHMTTLFNEKFGFQYDKDVLKNRNKTLRKLYKATRNLLNQSGFTWDETRQMVRADDDVWENYIKVHPAARAQRTKTMPYYSDLSLIYKTETGDVSHDSKLMNDSPGMEISGMSSSLKCPAGTHNVQESSCVVVGASKSDQQNRLLSPMPPASQPISINECMVGSPELKIRGEPEDPNSLAGYVAKADTIGTVQELSFHFDVDRDIFCQQNKLKPAIQSTSRLGSTNQSTIAYSAMETGGILDDSKSLALYVAHGDLVDNMQELSSNLSVDVDVFHLQNEQQSVMPSAVEKLSSDMGVMDGPGMQIDGVLEDMIETSEIQRKQHCTILSASEANISGKFILETPGASNGGAIEGPNSPAKSVAHGDKLNSSIADISDQQNYQQPTEGSTSRPSNINNNMVDSAEKKIGGRWEVDGPDSGCVSVDNQDTVRKAPNSATHSAEEGDISNKPNQQPSVILSSQPININEGLVANLQEVAAFVTPSANEKPDNSFSSIERQTAFDELNTGTSNRLRTTWTLPMDRYLVDLMLDQVHKGNMIDSACHKQAWRDMADLFNEKFGFQFDVDVLKNRHKNLRKYYNVVKDVLDQPGFAWDETWQMVSADDYVWNNYIKAHPEAAQCRTRPMPYYDDLCVIYRDTTVDGRSTCSDHDVDLFDDVPTTKLMGPSPNCEDPANNSGMDLYNQQDKRQSVTPLISQHLKKVRRASNGDMLDAFREMVAAVSLLKEKKKQKHNPVSVEAVIDALRALPDMDDDLILDACDFLEDEKMAKTFLALNVPLRKKWLMRKLRS